MKKILFLAIALVTSVCGAWAQTTVVARMQDFVSAMTAGVMPDAVPTWKTSETGGGIYTFNGSTQYIGGCANEAIDAAFKGDRMVTVAAWVYGVPGSNNCIFGYGDQNTGVKFMMNGTTFKTTTKGIADLTAVSNSNIQANKWNLIAFAFPGKTCSTQKLRYYATANDGQFNTYNVGSGQKMNNPNSNKCAVGSGNQGGARESYSGMIANLIVITSDGLLQNSAIKTLIGDAPELNLPDYAINFDNAAHSHTSGGRKVTQIKLADQTIDINPDGNFYQDLTASSSFTIKAGQSVKPQIIWDGSWMAAYVYVDKDASDKQFTVEELVASTAGEGHHEFTTDIPAFTIENQGDYRMRYKVDWNSTDPKGGNTLKSNGGYILDVMLHVEAPEDITYTLHVEGDVTDGVTVTYNENTITSGNTFEAPNSLGSGDLTVNGLPSYMASTIVINGQDVYVKTHYANYHPLTRSTALVAGKNYMIYNACLNGDEDRTGFVYGGDSRVAHCGNHPDPLVYQAGYSYLWTLEAGANGGFYIKNVANGKYYNATGYTSANPVELYIENFATTDITKGGNVKSVWGAKILTADVAESDGVYAISGSASGNSGQNCWNGNPTSFANWSNSHPWAFYEVCGVGATINADILAIASDYADYKVSQNGTHTNKYGTYQENTRASVEALSTSSTFEEYVTAVTNVVGVNVVVPTPGTFVRIQGVSGNYISGTAETKRVSNVDRRVTTDNADDAIFWYGTDGSLVGYKSGQGFTGTCEVAAVGATMNTQTFSGDVNSVNGTLTIMGSDSYFYDHSDPYGVVNRNGTNHHANCDWTVTDVESLPVLFKGAGKGYATLYSPVALEIPDGVTAYVGTLETEESTVKVSPIEDSIIPAETGVVLYKEGVESDTTVDFTITTGGTAATCFSGTVPAITKEENNYVFSIANKQAGFYKFAGATLAGFKAYYVPSTPSEVHAFVLDFGGQTVGIEGLQSVAPVKGAFDLQGRRVNAATRGLFIQNGKKVIK